MSDPTKKCPYCGTECTADFVDIGVGDIQCGPYGCDKCGAVEIGRHDEDRDFDEGQGLTPDEVRTGWYAPVQEPK